MKTSSALFAGALVSLWAVSAHAEVLEVPVESSETETSEYAAPEAPLPNFTKPRKGASMAEVTRLLGQPLVKHKPVGGNSRRNPPITRWDYDGYSVFFERSHVVDTVIKGRPAEVFHKDQLKR